jgi:DNA-binding transcriptional regulator YiaG
MRDWTPEDIKALRARFNVTQKHLADLLGVSRVYVGLLERNEKTPSKTLKLLLHYIEKELTAIETENEKEKGGAHGKEERRG